LFRGNQAAGGPSGLYLGGGGGDLLASHRELLLPLDSRQLTGF
jgi:hypothetical protein